MKLKKKLYAICVTALLLFGQGQGLWAEQSYAQSTRLSLELSNATINDVFVSVEKNSEYRFFYSALVRPELRQNVNVSFESKTIDQILTEVLKDTNLTYVLNDRQVMVVCRGEKAQQEKKCTDGLAHYMHDPNQNKPKKCINQINALLRYYCRYFAYSYRLDNSLITD